jgi:hypothetical protein
MLGGHVRGITLGLAVTLLALLGIAEAALGQMDPDSGWDERFFPNGVSGEVAAFALGGGTVYVGGTFMSAGPVAAANIAAWHGESWSSLGGGTNGPVAAIAVNGAVVYVGGTFSMAGNTSAANIARWDGNEWSALGSGTDFAVQALAMFEGDLHAAGKFRMAGGVAANRVARWDGESWTPLGTGTDGEVRALAVLGGRLCAGGDFATAGGTQASNVACWDGQGWEALGKPPFDVVATLLVDGSSLWAGGNAFGPQVARWDGANWTAFEKLDRDPFSEVRALALFQGALYAGGNFRSIRLFSNLVVLEGTQWTPLGNLVGDVNALAAKAEELYTGGRLLEANDLSVNGVVRWDGRDWLALGSPTIRQRPPGIGFAGNGTDVFTGGQPWGGADSTNAILSWNGTNWISIGTVSGILTPSITRLALADSGLYVAGSFTFVQAEPAKGLAHWDGDMWAGISDDPLPVFARAMVFHAGDLYIAANFAGNKRPAVLRWDGSTFSQLGLFEPTALATNGADLFAGGSSDRVNTSVVRWTGSDWEPLGATFRGDVEAIAAEGSDLYIGGSFAAIDGTSVNHIAMWDGEAWGPLGEGTDGNVTAIAMIDGNLYAGGAFAMAGGVGASKIARWDGSAWASLGTGLTGGAGAFALCAHGTDLFVNGDFGMAGGKPSSGFAIWHTTPRAPSTPTPTEGPATATPTRQATLTPAASCAGDCDGGGNVAINELVVCVNVALSSAAVSSCRPCDLNADSQVTINELIAAVNSALSGCPAG